MNMYRYCNVFIDSQLNISQKPKRSSEIFSSYEEYVDRMTSVLKGIALNATDSARLCKYKMATTVSRGYDACAASALVHSIGCEKALTFSSPQKYKSDSGVAVAERLGYKEIIEGDGCAYMDNKDLWEAESASSGDVGCLVAFNTFEKQYKDSLLFMGLKGDSIWGKHSSEANPNLDFCEMSIAAEQNPEHYLRNNTIAISIPLIFADNWPAIYSISNSEEMRPYSIGGQYDRPIPRRIVEEKGVPRDYFGIKKSGAGFTYRFQPTLGSLKHKMSPISYASLCEFAKTLHRKKYGLIKASVQYYKVNYPMYMEVVAKKLGIRYYKKPEKYVPSVTSQMLILWGMDVMKKRYNRALELIK